MQQTQLTSQIARPASRPGVRRMRSAWAQIPSVVRVLLKVHVTLLAMLLLVSSAVSVTGVDRGYERFAFALPAEFPRMAWGGSPGRVKVAFLTAGIKRRSRAVRDWGRSR